MCGHLLVTSGKADWDLAAECTSACGGSILTNSYNNRKHIYEPTRLSYHLTAEKEKETRASFSSLYLLHVLGLFKLLTLGYSSSSVQKGDVQCSKNLFSTSDYLLIDLHSCLQQLLHIKCVTSFTEVEEVTYSSYSNSHISTCLRYSSSTSWSFSSPYMCIFME